MADHITPAIQLESKMPLTPEEFQTHLYEYFQDKGILSDLRAHLRTQMIRALKDTSIGKQLVNKKKEISPKLQALNLLIAEYLLQKEYHYSLSVFSTEVPLNNIFPTFINENCHRHDLLTFRFSDNDMWDILETLGFLHSSDQGKTVSDSYRGNTYESLLNCIIRTCNSPKAENKLEFEIPKCMLRIESASNVTLESFVAFLRSTTVGPDVSIQIIEQIKEVIIAEMLKITENKDEEVLKIKEKLEHEANRKLERYKKKLSHMEHIFDKERKRLEVELEGAKSNLKDCAQSLHAKYKSINKLDEALKVKERQILSQAAILSEKEKMLQKQLEDVVVEKINYREMKERLADTQSVRSDDTRQERKETQEKEQQTLQTVNLENVLLRQNAHQLQLQIDGLRDQNAGYLSRIQELAQRTSLLMRELQDSQQRVQELNGSHRDQFIPVPLAVPSIPALTYRTNYGIASYSGAGEQGSNVPSLAPRHFKNTPASKDLKSRISRKHPSTSSSEASSPTEMVLQEAKQRLQNLEKESDQIDKHYNVCSSRTHCKKVKTCDPNGSPSNVLGEFQTNLQCLCQSLTRIFKNDSLICNDAGTSSQDFSTTHEGANVIYDKARDTQNQPSSKIVKIKNLIADLPLEGDDYEDVMNSLGLHKSQKDGNQTSGNSSAILLGVSFSTVDVSPEVKSDIEDGSPDAPQPIEEYQGEVSCTNIKIWDNVGLSCLLAFACELLLFR